MGLYDTIDFEHDVLNLCCAEGKHQLYLRGFQTKDFDRLMDRYFVWNNLLYVERTTDEERKSGHVRKLSPGKDDSHCLITVEVRGERVLRTVAAGIYTTCVDCRPVLYLSTETSPWGDRVRERAPWCEFTAHFRDGRLTDIVPVRNERRSDIVRELREGGAHVLEDHDTLAKRHFAKQKREG